MTAESGVRGGDDGGGRGGHFDKGAMCCHAMSCKPGGEAKLNGGQSRDGYYEEP